MTKRLLCLIFAVLVVLGCSPGAAYAAEGMFNMDDHQYVRKQQARRFEPVIFSAFARHAAFSIPQIPVALTDWETPKADISSILQACYPGDSGEAVAALQQHLKNLEYYDYPRITGYYGPVTFEAVKRFQRVNGLAANGVADSETIEKLVSGRAAGLCLYPGDFGRDILRLQRRLSELGYLTGKITGCLDNATVQALQEFQAQTGCRLSSNVDKSVRERLESNDAPPWDGMRRISGNTLSTLSTTPVDKMLSFAVSLLGSPYAHRTSGPDFFDDDGFVSYVLRYIGAIPGDIDAAALSDMEGWEKIVDICAVTRGDILFFTTSSGSVHTGISLGEGQFIHASASKDGVMISRLSGQYQRRFLFARRLC